MPKLRCINIDWLEVYCIEPMKLDANYYRALRYRVVQRDYGTPMYAEMFGLQWQGIIRSAKRSVFAEIGRRNI